MSNTTLGEKLRELREDHQLPLRKVAALLDIDVAILSKMERGKRLLTKNIVEKLSHIYNYDTDELLIHYLSEKVMVEIGDENLALKALQVAEEQLAYRAFLKTNKSEQLSRLIHGIKKFDKIEKAWIYGSFERGDDGPKSDIDLAIQTTGTFTYFDLAEVQHELEIVLKRKVDVGFIDSFKPHIFENVKTDLRLIYESKPQGKF